MMPNSDLSQFLLLPDMLEHWDLHKKEAVANGEQITFFDFFSEHYLENAEHEHDGQPEHPCMPMEHVNSGFQFVCSFSHMLVDGEISLTPVNRNMSPEKLLSSDFSQCLERPPSPV